MMGLPSNMDCFICGDEEAVGKNHNPHQPIRVQEMMPANYLPKKKKKTKKMRNHVSYNWAVLLSKEKKK